MDNWSEIIRVSLAGWVQREIKNLLNYLYLHVLETFKGESSHSSSSFEACLLLVIRSFRVVLAFCFLKPWITWSLQMVGLFFRICNLVNECRLRLNLQSRLTCYFFIFPSVGKHNKLWHFVPIYRCRSFSILSFRYDLKNMAWDSK